MQVSAIACASHSKFVKSLQAQVWSDNFTNFLYLFLAGFFNLAQSAMDTAVITTTSNDVNVYRALVAGLLASWLQDYSAAWLPALLRTNTEWHHTKTVLGCSTAPRSKLKIFQRNSIQQASSGAICYITCNLLFLPYMYCNCKCEQSLIKSNYFIKQRFSS